MSTTGMSRLDWLPRGRGLPDATWATRHRWVVRILGLQCVGIVIFALARGNSIGHSVSETVAPTLLALLALSPRLSKTVRSALAAGGLMVISTALVHLSNGFIEAHFHFFVMIPIVALYEAWIPFAVAVGVVLVHHGVMGAVDPSMLYNHPAAIAHPWVWAGIHTGAIALACAGAVVNWKAQERMREGEADLTARLVHLANHDPLTGLPSRSLFMDRLEQALLRGVRQGRSTSVLMLDMDGFKEVNDTFGHSSGDVVLIEVARRLSAVVRSHDTVTRMGGDEYTVLLVDTDAVAAEQAATRVAGVLAAPFYLGGVSVDLEVSIGVATSRSGDDALAVTSVADAAMYHAKEQRLGIVHFDEGDPLASTVVTSNRLNLLGDLRRALDEDEIVLHYQPKVDLATGSMVGVEALARWQHPDRGLLPPSVFIDLVERTNLSHQLTAKVLSLALGQARCWADDGRDVPVSVNLFQRGLLDPTLVALVADSLAEHGVAPRLLMLEITEMAIVSDPVVALAALHQLRDLGVRLSLDDFGTGYSSLAYLSDLPIEELKIDRTFVQHLGADHARDPILVRTAVRLGHELGLLVLAEGVEDAETRQQLTALGCDLAQGFYFARPVPADELGTWLTDAPLLTPL